MDNLIVEAFTEEGDLAYKVELNPDVFSKDEALKLGSNLARSIKRDDLSFWVDGEPVMFT